MKTSILYSNAVLSCRENKLLNSDRIKRMINAQSYTDSVKILLECGYNEELINNSPERDDLIINTELKQTMQTLSYLCPDENLTQCILLKYDYHNAKAFYKLRFTNIDLNEVVYEFGTIPHEKLKDCIKTKKYSTLPLLLTQALQSLDKLPAPAAKDIDFAIEKAMQEDIRQTADKIKNKLVKNYFTSQIDITNLKTAAKCRLYQLKKEELEPLLIEGGTLKKEQLFAVYNEKLEKIKTFFLNSALKEVITSLCESLVLNDLSVFEDYANSYLIKLSSVNKQNSYDINFLFHWYVMKLEELKIVKLILTAKKFNVSKKQLRDLLRERGAYEEFK